MFRKKHNQPALSAALVALSVAGSLGLGEWVLSDIYHFPRALAPHPPFGNILPGAHIHLVQRDFTTDMNFNSEGFRGPDFIDQMESGEAVLFLGDSFIEGFGVDEAQRASNRVENLLQKNPQTKNLRALNAGQTMTGPFAYFKNLIHFGVALSPRAVVVGLFMGNDFIGARHFPVPNGYKVHNRLPIDLNRKVEGPLWRLGFLRELLATGLKGKTTLQPRVNTHKYWEFFYGKPIDRTFFLEESGLPEDQYAKHLKRIPGDVLQDFFLGKINPSYLIGSFPSETTTMERAFSDDDIRIVFDTLYEMYFVCSQRNIPFLLVIYPSPYQVYPEAYTTHLKQNLGYEDVPQSLRELGGIQNDLTKWLTREGIAFVDLSLQLDQKDFFPFDGHLNETGHSKTARLIHKQLVSLIARSN